MNWAFWKRFLKAAAIRAGRTAAQTAIAAIGTTALLSQIDWLQVGSMTLLATILSLLNSVVTGLPEVQEEEDEDKAA